MTGKDERAYTKKAFAKMLTKDYERIKQKYGRQVQAVETYMEKLAASRKSRKKKI